MSDRSEKFMGKYRNESSRLLGWDYTSAGNYFITICTKERTPWFGKIVHGKMLLSEIGKIVQKFWTEIPKHFKYISLDTFVVMPDHIHGIIVIVRRPVVLVRPVVVGTRESRVPTNERGKLHLPQKSIGSVINQFKSTCTKKIRVMGQKDFRWQPRFYDYILKNKNDLQKIRRYIQLNPVLWKPSIDPFCLPV